MPIFVPVPKMVGVVYYESSKRKFKGKPDRCFYAVYRAGSRKVREKVGWQSEGVTAALASQVRSERIRDSRLGVLAPQKDVTLAEVWAKFIAWAKTNIHNHQSLASIYKLHIGPVMGKSNLKNISIHELERVQAEMVGKGLSTQSVVHALSLVRSLFNRAAEWGMWSGRNPVDGYKMPRPNNRRERFLSEGEAERLLSALGRRSEILRDMAFLSLHTGMRFGEVAALRWDHCNFDQRLITVMESGRRMTTKSGRSRTIPMTEDVRKMLLRRKAESRHDRVFRNTQDMPQRRADRTFKTVVGELGFNEGIVDRRQVVVFHTLRHTFASWLAIRGVPLITIRDLLGHSTISMTERYSHLMPNQGRSAIDILPRLSGQSCGPDSSPGIRLQDGAGI